MSKALSNKEENHPEKEKENIRKERYKVIPTFKQKSRLSQFNCGIQDLFPLL